jgi:carbonic anhydrase
MKCYSALLAATALVCANTMPSVSSEATLPAGQSWGYWADSDPNVFGPTEWSKVFTTCGGKRQSPINIVTKSTTKKTTTPFTLTGSCAKYGVHQYYDAFKVETISGASALSANTIHDCYHSYFTN